MFDWLLTLPLLGKLWLAYAVGAGSLLALAFCVELRAARKVDGAGGWLIFGAIMIAFYALVLTALASLVIALLRWLW